MALGNEEAGTFYLTCSLGQLLESILSGLPGIEMVNPVPHSEAMSLYNQAARHVRQEEGLTANLEI